MPCEEVSAEPSPKTTHLDEAKVDVDRGPRDVTTKRVVVVQVDACGRSQLVTVWW